MSNLQNLEIAEQNSSDELVDGGLSGLITDTGNENVKEIYRIGDLAKEFSVTLRALRFYEDRGLIKPRRTGSTRLYTGDDRERLKLILQAKRFGFKLADIQDILKTHDNDSNTKAGLIEITEKFKSQISVLEEQSRELEQAKEELISSIEYLESIT